MAKTIKEPIRRSTISGIFVDEMTEEQKAAIIARNPKAEKLFENWVAPTPPEPIVE